MANISHSHYNYNKIPREGEAIVNRNYETSKNTWNLTSMLDFIEMQMRKVILRSFFFVLMQTFFEALGRVKEIHNDCKLLLRTKQQTAG